MTETRRQAAGMDKSLAEAAHLQAIEGNPLQPRELTMFEKFEHERWPPEERRAYIASQFGGRGNVTAAE